LLQQTTSEDYKRYFAKGIILYVKGKIGKNTVYGVNVPSGQIRLAKVQEWYTEYQSVCQTAPLTSMK
jgi:hypothetical protein